MVNQKTSFARSAPESLNHWIERHPGLYPFHGKFLPLGCNQLHYLDEGSGEVVVMVHGNPTWSFFYRDLIRGLDKNFRLVVPDHIGCGRSSRPTEAQYPYTLESRVADLDALIQSVAGRNPINLVVHDWGGMIGSAWAVRNPERVKRLVFFNTAAFGLPTGSRLPRSLQWCRSQMFGPLLVQGFNLFCKGAVRFCSIQGLSTEVRSGFLAPYSSWRDRLAVLKFVQDIPLAPGDPSFSMIEETAALLPKLEAIPKAFFWGRKDFVFNDAFLNEWMRRFPSAKCEIFEKAGHYLLEDAGEIIIPKVREFLLGE